jgi:hypothetical protein
MREYRLREDLQRTVIDGFALPLGFVPARSRTVAAPAVGYTVDYTTGEDDEPDTYAFYAVVSHDRLAPILHRALEMLPDEVHGILEIGSRDAYRSVDVYMGRRAIGREEFLESWEFFEPFILEDGSVGCGANSDDPFVEVFVDQWKGLSLHVPLGMREEVEELFAGFGLREVLETWPMGTAEDVSESLRVRSVLAIGDEFDPDVDEMVLQLRQAWNLELNVDPEANVDDSGRALGSTLWHAMVLVQSAKKPRVDGYASIWATASSLAEMEMIIDQVLEDAPQWRYEDIYTIDRVAFDERPDELADLAPRRDRSEVHLVEFET